jgi:hypothetical protein
MNRDSPLYNSHRKNVSGTSIDYISCLILLPRRKPCMCTTFEIISRYAVAEIRLTERGEVDPMHGFPSFYFILALRTEISLAPGTRL